METILIKLGVQLVVFSAVIAVATWRLPGVSVRPRRWLPVLTAALVALNASLYWLLAPLIALVLPIVGWLLAPFFANLAMLWGASKLVRRITIVGMFPLSLLVAVAHLAMSIGFYFSL